MLENMLLLLQVLSAGEIYVYVEVEWHGLCSYQIDLISWRAAFPLRHATLFMFLPAEKATCP